MFEIQSSPLKQVTWLDTAYYFMLLSMHSGWLNRTTFLCQKIEKDNRNISFHLVLKLIRNESDDMNPRKKTRPMTYGSVHRVVWDRPQWEIPVLWEKLKVHPRSAEADLNLDHFNFQGRTWIVSLDLAQVWDTVLIREPLLSCFCLSSIFLLLYWGSPVYQILEWLVNCTQSSALPIFMYFYIKSSQTFTES